MSRTGFNFCPPAVHDIHNRTHLMGERLAEEHKKINDELLAKIGRPKVPRNREKGSPSSVTEAQLGMIGM